jgi:hypothetical protein
MAVTVKRASMWRKEISNKPGTLADSLKTLSKAGVNLQTVMGYVYPGQPKKAAVEVYPISGSKAERAARSSRFKAGGVHCLLVEGDDKVGLCHRMADAICDAGINLNFVVIQVFGRKYSGWFGFKSEAEAARAIPIIKAVNSGKSLPGKQKAANRKPSKVKKAAKKLGAKVIKLASARKRKKGTTAKAAMRRTSSKKRTKKKTSKRR